MLNAIKESPSTNEIRDKKYPAIFKEIYFLKPDTPDILTPFFRKYLDTTSTNTIKSGRIKNKSPQGFANL